MTDLIKHNDPMCSLNLYDHTELRTDKQQLYLHKIVSCNHFTLVSLQ